MKTTETLLFVDTNVLLDFYRIRSDASLSLLSHLESLKDRLVMTSQVEMEFKKNRQAVMLEGLSNLKPPVALSLPAIMRDSKKPQAAQSKIREAERLVKGAKEKFVKIIGDPINHDRVFQAVQRLFTHACPLNLTRENDERFAIRRRALKRFALGYRRQLRELGSEQKALEALREIVYKSILDPKRRIYAIFGTHSRFGHWMISALYHVPQSVCAQDVLFQ